MFKPLTSEVVEGRMVGYLMKPATRAFLNRQEPHFFLTCPAFAVAQLRGGNEADQACPIMSLIFTLFKLCRTRSQSKFCAGSCSHRGGQHHIWKLRHLTCPSESQLHVSDAYGIQFVSRFTTYLSALQPGPFLQTSCRGVRLSIDE